MKNQFFLSYKDYLEKHYGGSAFRIGVDGGFGCPNRSSGRQGPGCTFCAEEGARSPYTTGAQTLENQIAQGKAFLQDRYGAQTFLLYFQAYSSTHAPVAQLKDIYDRGLACGPFRELIVSTRPDCISPEVAKLLGSYITNQREVWVELGLQSCHDKTLKAVHRGHTSEDYRNSVGLLHAQGVKTAAHVIYGLPGEGLADFLETVAFVRDLGTHGIKFHNLLIPPGTLMHQQWEQGEIQMPSMEAYLEGVLRALEILPPDTVVIRLSTDFPGREDDLPGEVWPKNRFFNRLVQEMARRNTFQGRLVSTKD